MHMHKLSCTVRRYCSSYLRIAQLCLSRACLCKQLEPTVHRYCDSGLTDKSDHELTASHQLFAYVILQYAVVFKVKSEAVWETCSARWRNRFREVSGEFPVLDAHDVIHPC